jgi:hypothetical protein
MKTMPKSRTFMFIFLLSLVAILSCSKESLPETNPWVGTWRITKVDSAFTPFNRFLYNIECPLDYTGSFTFNTDSTGYLKGSITQITEREELFLWHYDTTYPQYPRIYFGFLNGNTESFVVTLSSDTARIVFIDYLYLPGIMGGRWCWPMELVKQRE